MEFSKWLMLMVLLVTLLLGGRCDGCWDQEKTALFQLKPFFPHVQNDWVEENQSSSSDCCQWKSVECNSSTGRVIRLFLNVTSLTPRLVYDVVNDDLVYDYYETEYNWRNEWYLNASLFLPFEKLNSLYLTGNSIAGCVHNQGFEKLSSKLDKLEILDLSFNHFNDSLLASLSEFSSLKSLNLSHNQFTGIKGLPKLKNLETLDLHSNILGNNILSHLEGFTSLKSLRLQTCGLKGTVDMLEFNNLINLKELYLGDNQIESLKTLFPGNSSSIGKGQLRMIKLEVLGLSSNLFNNSIFLSLAALSNLKILYLGSNKLEGSIHIKELNALINLKELYMPYNEVNDFVPSQGNATKLRLMNLEVLDLEGNLFNGSIFSSLDRLLNLKSLYLDVNKLDGSRDLKVLDASSLEELFITCITPEDFAVERGKGHCSLPPKLSSVFPSSLKTLFLIGFNFNETMTTQKLHSFANLEELTVENSILETDLLRTIGELTSLKSMSLDSCSINIGSLAISQEWQKLTSLKELEVFDCKVNGSLLLHGPLQLKNLESLTIYNASLESNFLQKIGAMPSLKFLELNFCGLNGTLHTQGFCELTSLQHLDLSYNNLMGNLVPECFSNLTSLESLYLTSNQFSGNIYALKSLTSLESLDLSFNQFSGNISVLNSLTSLESLDPSFNQFSGNISALNSLTSLESLDLSSNQFSGNISALKSLTSLQSLDLSYNNFQIPSSLGPLFNLSNLKFIDANNNAIYAEIEMYSFAPTFQLNVIRLSGCGDVGSFPQFLYHQGDLIEVDLSNINLRGEFPNWLLENNTNLRTLFLANNSLLGYFKLPFLSHARLLYLDISKNSFYGHIPIEIGAKLPSLKFLNMSNNYFGGSIPASICDVNSLQILDLSNNKLSGGLPKHLTMRCFSLNSLKLSNNRLQGQMFSSNFNLTNLMELQLDGNHFFGKIPDCLSNCSFLSRLDLSNNQLVGGIPSWMGNMSSLEEIVMANNHLEGPIPVKFCQLNLNLKLLDLSVNNISGNLPSCFSPLWISQVHLSRNKLQGPLINAFHNSTILVTLDLSNNHLTGNIPNWIGRLSQLSYLLLNNNHFEGRIPVQLCKLGYLSLINLSNNNLSGTIPPCLKITTLNDISQDYARYVNDFGPNSSFSIEEPIEFITKTISYFYKGRILALLSGIDLSCNKLIGEIPHEVKNFQNIFALNLSHNSLTGPIPQALSDLKQIESLDLSYNNLSGKIPRQLVGLYRLSVFSVAYNNLSGSTPEWIAQFATFGESSYMGNHFLCGAPLPKCSTSGPSSSILPKSSSENDSIDMEVFYVSFVVSYVMVLLCIASVLYINPYWRQAWFYHIDAGITSCYYFYIDNILPKRFHCGNM